MLARQARIARPRTTCSRCFKSSSAVSDFGLTASRARAADSNCGGPIDLHQHSACPHCASPLSILDSKQAATLVAELRKAGEQAAQVDPTLPLSLERARRETNAAFDAFERDDRWLRDVSSAGLVGAGLTSLARWLKRQV